MPTYSQSTRQLYWVTHLAKLRQSSNSLKPWLLDKGSLTSKLMALSQGKFRVQVLQQVYARARRDEARVLGIPFSQLCLVRQVVLLGSEQPWVFARSLLPLSSLNGRLRHLRKRGSRPLGAFLFDQPHLERSPIAVCAMTRQHHYVPDELLGNPAELSSAPEKPVWGRRSIFYLDAKPLLVSEVFLPLFPLS